VDPQRLLCSEKEVYDDATSDCPSHKGRNTGTHDAHRWYQAWDAEYQDRIQQEVKNALNTLNYGFSSTIYPDLTSNFGSEWKPGIDKDERITVLFHPMKEEARGYFNSGDEYPKLQNPTSNE